MNSTYIVSYQQYHKHIIDPFAIISVVMADQSNNFYSYIQEKNHHDAWRIIVLVFVLAIIGLLSWFLSSSNREDVTLMNTKNANNMDISPLMMLTDAELSKFLDKQPPIPPTNPDMTDAERIKLITGKPPEAPMLQ